MKLNFLKNLPFILFSSLCATSWSPANLITNNDVQSPSISISENGDGIFLYTHTNACLFSKRFNSYDEIFSDELQISNIGLSFGPKSSVDKNGNAVAAWYKNNGSAQFYPYASFLLNNSQSWSSPLQLSSNQASNVELSSNPNGDAVIVWNTNNFKIVESARLVDLENFVLETIYQETGAYNLSGARVSVDSEGNALALWLSQKYGDAAVFSSRQIKGQSWQTPVRINGFYPIDAPAVCTDLFGDSYALIQRIDSDGKYRLQVTKLAKDSNTWDDPFDLYVGGYSCNSFKISSNSKGAIAAFWVINQNIAQTAFKAPNSTNWMYAPRMPEFYQFIAGSQFILDDDNNITIIIRQDYLNEYPLFSLTLTNQAMNWSDPTQIKPLNVAVGSITATSNPQSKLFSVYQKLPYDAFELKTLPAPPTQVKGSQKINNFGFVKERYNQIEWNKSPQNGIDGYKVYTNGSLEVEVASEITEVQIHNQPKSSSVISVSSISGESESVPVISIVE